MLGARMPPEPERKMTIYRPKKIHPPRPPKPPDRPQNPRPARGPGDTKYISAHWRWDYGTHSWAWVHGHWSK